MQALDAHGLAQRAQPDDLPRFGRCRRLISHLPHDTDEPFDQKYMTALFDRGYDMGNQGYPWVKSLPDLQTAGKLSRSKL